MKNIEFVFDEFVTCLEKQIFPLENEIMASNVTLISSHLGTVSGKSEVIKRLQWQGPSMTVSKVRIFNNVIRQYKDYAKQSVYILFLMGKEINSFMHHFQCGFLSSLDYIYENNQWLIKTIRMNMVYETGNSLFVANWWNLIDYSCFEGNHLHIIDKKRQSPWEVIPKNDFELSDEDQIKECFWHYNWLLDTNDIDGIYQLTTQNCFPGDRYASREEWLETLKMKREKEACWAHISTFRSIEKDGNKARAIICRYEPNRIGNKFLHKYNIMTVFYSAKWIIDFVKVNDGWVMDYFINQKGIIEENNSNEKRYF